MSQWVNRLRYFGKTRYKHTTHLCYGRVPEYHQESLPVLPRPTPTTTAPPERMIAMPCKSKPKVQTVRSAAAIPATLAALLKTLEANPFLAPMRLRDLRSAVNGVAALLGEEPAAIPLDVEVIGARLAAV